MMRAAMMGLAAVLLLGGTAMAAEGTLTLYTSQPDTDARRTVDGFTAANPGVKVTIFRSGTTEVMNKLQAEFAAGAPQADLALIADFTAMAALKRDHRLAAYPQAPVGKLDPALYDKDRTYFSTKRITTGIVYNTKAPKVPESWHDLADPAAKGQVVMPSPLYSGAAVIHVGTLAAMPEFGWPYFEALAKGGATAVRANGQVIRSVATGEKLYGVVVDYVALNEAAKGAPVKFVFPREGVTAVTEPVAILGTAKNVAAARAFVDWILSPAGQAVQASLGYMPADPSIKPPPNFPVADIHVLPTDVGALLKADEDNKQKFSELFGG